MGLGGREIGPFPDFWKIMRNYGEYFVRWPKLYLVMGFSGGTMALIRGFLMGDAKGGIVGCLFIIICSFGLYKVVDHYSNRIP